VPIGTVVRDADKKTLGQIANDARELARTEPKGRAGRPRQDGTQASGPRPGHDRARALKHARYALWKNPENLTAKQQTKLDWVAATDPVLHRAYLLKEGLRTVFVLGHNDGPDAGIEALDRWLAWAARSRLEAFVELGRKIRRHRQQIEAAIREDLSNALVESTNTKIRVLTRVAFGFHSAQAVIALARRRIDVLWALLRDKRTYTATPPALAQAA